MPPWIFAACEELFLQEKSTAMMYLLLYHSDNPGKEQEPTGRGYVDASLTA